MNTHHPHKYFYNQLSVFFTLITLISIIIILGSILIIFIPIFWKQPIVPSIVGLSCLFCVIGTLMCCTSICAHFKIMNIQKNNENNSEIIDPS